MYLPLVIAAGLLALIYGASAGSTMVAMGLGIGAFPPAVAIVVLATAVALMPLLVGTAVATTMASRLVSMRGPAAQLFTLVAVVSAIIVVGLLGSLSIPTSLTLALVGGLAGAGLGAGNGVAWSPLGLVLATLALAPVVGAAVANQIMRALRSTRPSGTSVRRRLLRMHVAGFVAFAAAFGANDAQKLLAVMAIGVVGAHDSVQPTPWMLTVLGALFAMGSGMGMGMMSRSTSSGVIALRTVDAVVAQGATATVMIASTAIGSPCGMAQTLTGSLVGAGLAKGRGSIRWDYAGRVLAAWAATLPGAFALALVMGLAVNRLSGQA